jgi:hypothetical protein
VGAGTRDGRAVCRFTLFFALAGCSSFEPTTGPPGPSQCVNADSDPSAAVNFHQQIRPLLNRRLNNASGPGCSECHYPFGDIRTGIDQGELDLSTLGALRRGGITSGASIVVPGCPCDSALVLKLLGVYSPALTQMPKWAPRAWTPTEIQLVSDWIAEGANGADTE